MKNTRNLKLKGYEFGVKQIGQVGEAAGIAGGTISSLSGYSDTGNVLSGIGTGVGAGAAFGPIGMVAGGILGGVTGILGNNQAKKQEEMQRAAIKRQQDIAKFNQLRGQSAQRENEYYSQYGENVATFANGGVVGSEMAYVDNNESVRTPDGNMYKVQGFNPKATDDVLTNLPNGSGILSDKLIIPGTNKTFAQAGHKLQKDMNKGKGSIGSIADRTNQLNKWAANQKYNGFLTLQDDIKVARGLVNKTKAYVYGDSSTNDDEPYGWNSSAAQQLTPPIQQTIQPTSYNTTYTNPTVNTNNVIPSYTGIPTQPVNNVSNTGNLSNKIFNGLENATYGLASMSPIMYNLYRGSKKPEFVAPNNNPYSSAVTSLMGRRRIDAQPLLDDNREATRIANYNANNITGTGQNMAFKLANAAAEREANANVRMKVQQVNNDYRAQEAEVLNSVGQQYVKEMNYADDLSRRNRERTKDFTATALTQLNDWGQTKQLSKNRKISDNQKYEIWKQLSKYGLSKADLESIDKIFK